MKIDFSLTKKFYTETEYKDAYSTIINSNETLKNRNGLGNDYLGWLDLPDGIKELNAIKEYASKIRKESKILLVLGIGGSYLGAKSAIEMLSKYMIRDFEIIFAGNNMSGSYLNELYQYLKDKDFSLNIISKSGSTTETAIATRLFLDLLISKYGNKAYDRVYATTDLYKGILNNICKINNIPMLDIPDNVGGRYSVLTAVGLLPIAVAGFDIEAIINGAKQAKLDTLDLNNDIFKLAALRYLFYKKGYSIEILSSFEPKMSFFGEWYKQLFAESEGKGNKGIFPAYASFSTDLHSIGQMIQDGKRNIIETMIAIQNPGNDIKVCGMKDNLDNLDFILNESVNTINNKALKATSIAHMDGGVPVSIINIDTIDEYNYGYLVFFFEYLCGISAYSIGVNPFDQPGVESYKRNMFALIGKPGYEDIKKELEERIKGDK